VVIDCAIGFADRPFGIRSPQQTLLGNLLPPLRVLEIVRKLDKKSVVIYPSSFNACYAHKTITENTLPDTTSLYGWTKRAVENLCRVHHRAYDVPIIITRVGSCFGPKGRSDELPHRLIIYALRFIVQVVYVLLKYQKKIGEIRTVSTLQ
jgi:nucleoside-diphosphate-sugar epimerase